MDDNIQSAGLPASLADADPFGASPVPRSTTARTQPTTAPASAPVEASSFVPCPCSCGCGNLTNKTYSEVESLSAAKHLRCESCGKAFHFGPRWITDEPASNVTETASADKVVTGERSGETFVIRERVIDPLDAEWERQVARQLEQERRDAARDRWLQGLPERWQLPYDDGEELVPEVEERLARLKDGRAADHGTSLLCIGPFGSGKTWVAYTYARAAVDRWLLWPQQIRIGTEAEIVEPIAAASPWEVEAKMKELLKPTLRMLVIDDVGAFSTYRTPEARWAAFGKIIDWMYAHKRTVVITTNFTLGVGGELDKWIGTRPYERLKSMVGQHQVFRDEDKRSEMTLQWEAEYQAMKAKAGRD
jgi:DNA replication protein DnaC